MRLSEHCRQVLLDTAWTSIHGGINGRVRSPPSHDGMPETVLDNRASFVTLMREGALRGCCGSLRAYRALLDDVHDNAWRTAFDDSRFPPLTRAELEGLSLEISVLSAMTPVSAESREQLLESVRPHYHGLLIAAGARRATFLPKVWDSLPEPSMFLDQLLYKAGLPLNEWPGNAEAWVYTTELFGK